MADIEDKLQRALAHHQNGQLAEAAALYQDVLRSEPDKADALYLFGCLAYQTGNTEVARQVLTRAVAADTEQPEYCYALGLALGALKDYAEAAKIYQRAVELQPKHLNALAALGDALQELQRPAEAVAAYRRVLVIDAARERVWYGCGCAENARGEFGAARDCFTKALELLPDWLEARHNLGRALYELGLVSEAFKQFQICAEMDLPGSEQARAMMAVIVPGVPEAGNADVLETRRSWAERDLNVADRKPPVHVPGRPLRVGYVSAFFQRDNWMKPVWGLINQHDRDAVRLYLFSDCAAAAIQHGYRGRGEDQYFDTSKLSNNEIADLVATHEIDVLVDLNGYSNMRRLRLLAQKIAPVVMGWFNMYAATGLPGFDYLIGDAVVMPAEEERFYSEKILRVEGSYLTFDVSYPVPPVVERKVDAERFVFGSLASQYKITDEVVEAWSAILKLCPASCLLLKNKQMAATSSREDLVRRFARFGIANNRLEFEGPEPHYAFLRAYERIDLALDTFPYNGGTTTTEALWQGVPVVTFMGDRWASRTSASLLIAGGLGEFVAADMEGYVELAARWANERRRLVEMRLSMRETLLASKVCNTLGFARQMEKLYAEAVRQSGLERM